MKILGKCIALILAYAGVLAGILVTTNIENAFIKVPIITVGIGIGWWIIKELMEVLDGASSPAP
jgi:hypothetical protein